MDVQRTSSLLRLRYQLVGDVGAIIWPAAAVPGFADDLWRHTCFEAFLAVPDSTAYLELNLSPSQQWAAYAFDDRRQGMQRVEGVAVKSLEFASAPSIAVLTTLLDLGPYAPVAAGFSAVIEQATGQSHWALAHPPGPPDFHDPACFTARLPPPDAP